VVDAIGSAVGRGTPVDRAHGELANLVTAADSVLRSATVRCETRGAHARSDHPDTLDEWRCRIVHSGGGIAVLGGPRATGPDPRRGPGPGAAGR
jgi:hypothetical protein